MKGDVATETERGAGASGTTENAQLARTDVGGHLRMNLPRYFWSSSLVVNAKLVLSCAKCELAVSMT